MANPFEPRLNRIASQHITPLLRRHGFRKQRSSYQCPQTGVVWIVDIERGRFTNSWLLEFAVGCGIYAPEVYVAYVSEPPPNVPYTEHCCVYGRLGKIGGTIEKWWELTEDDDETAVDSRVAAEICGLLESEGLPFLTPLRTIEDVVQLLDKLRFRSLGHFDPGPPAFHAYAGLLHAMLGNREEAHAALDTYFQEIAQFHNATELNVMREQLLSAVNRKLRPERAGE